MLQDQTHCDFKPIILGNYVTKQNKLWCICGVVVGLAKCYITSENVHHIHYTTGVSVVLKICLHFPIFLHDKGINISDYVNYAHLPYAEIS